MDPMAVDGILRLLVLIPVVGRSAITTNKQIANLSLWHDMAAFISNQGFIAWNRPARATWTYLSEAVANEDMQDFGTADAIEDIDVEAVLPAPQDIGGQCLACRNTDTH